MGSGGGGGGGGGGGQFKLFSVSFRLDQNKHYCRSCFKDFFVVQFMISNLQLHRISIL